MIYYVFVCYFFPFVPFSVAFGFGPHDLRVEWNARAFGNTFPVYFAAIPFLFRLCQKLKSFYFRLACKCQQNKKERQKQQRFSFSFYFLASLRLLVVVRTTFLLSFNFQLCNFEWQTIFVGDRKTTIFHWFFPTTKVSFWILRTTAQKRTERLGKVDNLLTNGNNKALKSTFEQCVVHVAMPTHTHTRAQSHCHCVDDIASAHRHKQQKKNEWLLKMKWKLCAIKMAQLLSLDANYSVILYANNN